MYRNEFVRATEIRPGMKTSLLLQDGSVYPFEEVVAVREDGEGGLVFTLHGLQSGATYDRRVEFERIARDATMGMAVKS